MAISPERFQWALDQLDPTQWRYFERLATVFLSDEYPSLRPVAAMSGDGGADAMLFEVEDDPTVILQFSVRKDFAAKVEETCKRIAVTHPKARVLIYVTNQQIGSDSVNLRKKVRGAHGLYLDPRDREWLITVRNNSSATMAEAEDLAHKIVDPLLGNSGTAINQQAQALDDLEAKAAFVYLGLQWADDTREKGLTKLSFEALVRSVLRDTTSENRKSRAEVHALVNKLLPGHHKPTLKAQVDGALKRLNKKFIRSWMKLDEFCLTWEERVRLAERLSELNSLDESLRARLRDALQTSMQEMGEEVDAKGLDGHVELSRSIIERVLLDRGEAFAIAVARDRGGDVPSADVEAVIDTVVARERFQLQLPPHVLAATLQALLVNPPEDVRKYLRSLADTYTLFAFMRETPDVQSAVVKMFSEGDIWLDSSFVLPLFAEDLLEPEARSHSELLRSTRECGLKLHITEGVLEEIVTHMRRALSYDRAKREQGARGAAPFLLGAYELAGSPHESFDGWIENFYGNDPEVDVLEYLEEVHGIELTSLTEFSNEAPLDWRAAVAEVWHESRDYRDRRNAALGLPAMDTATRDKLVAHDVENYLGIVMRRTQRNEKRSAFGYKSWWLTLDRTAYRVNTRLQEIVSGKPPASPAISPDFILNYLAIGPVRARLSRRSEEALPLMVNMSVLDAVPADLVSLATDLRSELAGRDPRVVRRKIRETLEDARRLVGPKAKAGEVGLTDEVKARLMASARKR
ncbi:MAG: hypothetical protein AB7L91_18750 [Dehalococcoidia bacterium]